MMLKVKKYTLNLALTFFAIANLIIFSSPEFAKTGIGFIVGSPTAFIVKINNFPVIQLGYSLLDNNKYFSAAVDYWLWNPTIGGNFKFFVGVGVGLKIQESGNTDAGLGIRIPVGAQWNASKLIEVFAQTVPTLNVLPATTFGNDWGVGVRFYFL